MSAGLIKDGHMTANDTFAQRETRSSSVHLCEGRINPAIEPWIAEHAVRRAVGGSDAPSNVLPAHQKCAREKDRVDISENARGKRVSDKHFGIVKKRGFNRRRDMKFNWQAGRYE
jgi:5-methylcytosine-specific restriction protein A